MHKGTIFRQYAKLGCGGLVFSKGLSIVLFTSVVHLQEEMPITTSIVGSQGLVATCTGFCRIFATQFLQPV